MEDTLLKPIHVIAAPRTGSTFIWQCLTTFIVNNCCREDVLAAGDENKFWAHMVRPLREPIHGHKHNWLDSDEGRYFAQIQKGGPAGPIDEHEYWCDIIMTERNYIDSYLSHLRIEASCNDTFLKTVNDKKILRSKIDFYRDELQYMEYLKQNYKGNIVLLQYEKFVDNYDYIFKKFEESFCIKPTWPWKLILNDHIKAGIKTKTARSDSVKIQDEAEKSFSNPHRLHKRHIWSKKINYGRDILTKENYNYLLEEFSSDNIIPKRNVSNEYKQNCEDRGGLKTITSHVGNPIDHSVT